MAHDVYRVHKGGKPTVNRVIRGLDVHKRHGGRSLAAVPPR
jgi:sulfatase maturation enzyme AslB (radical SAM superfamily)